MNFKHAKNTVGLLQFGRNNQYPIMLSRYRYSGTGGAHSIHQKGKNIARAMRGQPIISVEVVVLTSDAKFFDACTYGQAKGIPVLFSAIELEETLTSNIITQIIADSFLRPSDEVPGVLFQCAGYIDDADIVAETGQYIITRLIIKADEFYPGRKPENFP